MDDPTCLALCAGIGGLELGVHAAIGCRVVGYVERDAYAAAVLLARMEDSSLAPAPVWCGNLEDMDTSSFLGVDIITAGFPCQPFSVAGKRRGIEDDRWIWPDIARIIRDVGPRLVFLENVPGLVQHGMPHVLGSLADLGFDAEWDLFRASDVEAPQRRERLFILAHADRGRELQPGWGEPDERRWSGDRGEAVADATSDIQWREGQRDKVRLRERSNKWPAWPPGPEDGDGWRRWISACGPEPCLRGDAARIPDRVDRLRCLGNSVVPQQAELAFRTLFRRMI